MSKGHRCLHPLVYKQILIGQGGRVNQITLQEVGVPYPVWINTEGLKIIEEKVLTVHNLGCPVVSRVTILEIFFRLLSVFSAPF